MGGWKEKVKKNPERYKLLFWILNHVMGRNRFHIDPHNTICAEGALMRHCTVTMEGKGNQLVLEPLCRLEFCEISIRGNGNRIVIGKHSNISHTRFCAQDNNNIIALGEECMLVGPTELAATEETRLVFGKGCMCSALVDVRTGDSHAVYDAQGARCNAAQDVCLDEKVWLGNRAMVLKGVHLAQGCIVGAGSVVTHSCEESNCALAGNAARVIQRNVRWTAER